MRLLFIMVTYMLLLQSVGVQAQETNIPTESIVMAIYHAEGGRNTRYPFGIKSLKYENRTDRSLSRHDWAKWIATNTVNNNKRRFKEYRGNMSFIEFLGSKYCPVKEHKLNVNWVGNVRSILQREDRKCK